MSSPSRREEIADLYRRYGTLVDRRCTELLKDRAAAEDARQEVFVKVMRSIGQFRNESSPSTWILRIATNHCLNVLASERAGWHERFRLFRRTAAEMEVQKAGAVERTEAVRMLFSRIDRETQAVAIHYFLDEMTQAEIASALGRSLPTIRKRLNKFLRIAKKELGHDFG